MTEEQKADYVLQYEAKEGVKLDPSSIIKNPGRRQVAKLALNSFWGRQVHLFFSCCIYLFLFILLFILIISLFYYRFGMNVNKDQLTFVNKVSHFNKIMTDATKNVSNILLLITVFFTFPIFFFLF